MSLVVRSQSCQATLQATLPPTRIGQRPGTDRPQKREVGHTREESKVYVMCNHQPKCPPATAHDSGAASLVIYHPEQGWGLLCNGVILFEDTGEILPDGSSVSAHRTLLPYSLKAA
jgi:hypothetical protein